MASLPLVVSAFGLGLAYAAVPGVVNAEAMRRGFTAGFWPAFLLQSGALLGDATWAILALTGTGLLVRHALIGVALGLIGSAFLFKLARTALVAAVDGPPRAAGTARPGNAFVVGVIFSVANPAGLAFWTGLGGAVLGTVRPDNVAASAAAFLAAFLVGALLWGAGMAGVVAFGRRRAGSRFFRWVNAASGFVLGYFGLRLLWTTVRRFGRLLPLAARLVG